jgi:hypothetical protein
MTFHLWGEENFDWEALYKAEQYLRKWANRVRCGIHSKEKYGTLRVSLYPFDGTLDSLLYPGCVSIQWKSSWMIDFDFYVCNFLSKYTPFVGWIQRLQLLVVRWAWRRAAKKWPHIADEILDEYWE